MRILVYLEPLSVPTSGNPGRGMIKELIRLRKDDHFILVVRTNPDKNKYLSELIKDLGNDNNWELHIQKPSRRICNVKALLGIEGYCNMSKEADVYMNMDCDYMGKSRHPLIITVADLSVSMGKNKSSYTRGINYRQRKFVLDTGLKHAEYIAAISDSTRSDIINLYPDRKARDISTIHNGIANEWFADSKPAVTDKKYFVWWGFISSRKNIEGLLKGYEKAWAFGGFDSEFPTIKLIYSNAIIPEHIQKLITELGISSKVVFVKALALPDLIDLVSASKGLIFPSFIEGFGLPVIEGLARGIPVLAADTSVMHEIGKQFVEYCDPYSAESIGQGILRLVSQHSSFTKSDVEARISYSKKFTYKKAAAYYSELIDQVFSAK